MLIDIGNNCIECLRDTSFGSGELLFVNRIPSDNDKYSGYLCPECQLIECQICDQKVLDEWETVNGIIFCTINDTCIEESNKEKDLITLDEVKYIIEKSISFSNFEFINDDQDLKDFILRMEVKL